MTLSSSEFESEFLRQVEEHIDTKLDDTTERFTEKLDSIADSVASLADSVKTLTERDIRIQEREFRQTETNKELKCMLQDVKEKVYKIELERAKESQSRLFLYRYWPSMLVLMNVVLSGSVVYLVFT